MNTNTNATDDATTDNSGVDIDDLLNLSIDDIADLPEFVLPPAGNYILAISSIEKKVDIGEKKSKCIEFRYIIKEVVELTNPDEITSIKVGDMFSEAYFLPQGLEYAKKHLIVLAESFGLTNINDVIAATVNIDVAATIGHRLNKKSKEMNAVVKSMLVL